MTDTTQQFDPTKPVQTRDGRKARIICTNIKGMFPIAAVVAVGDKSEGVEQWCANGRKAFSSTEYNSNPTDLINIPVKHKLTGYLDVHIRSSGEMFAEWHQHSLTCSTNAISRIDLSKLNIEFEEGEGIT